MKFNKLWLVVVMFAVMAVPAMAVINYNTDVDHAILVDYTDSSTAITDPTGNGFDGTLSGATIDTTDGYMNCDGVNDLMTVSHPANLSGDWSTSIAVYVDTKASNTAFVGKYASSTDRYYSFMSNTNWNFRTLLDGASYKDAANLNAGQWYIYTIINDATAGTVKQYRDTTLANTGTNENIVNSQPWEFCKVSALHGYLDGRITQWYMFNKALDSSELAAHVANVTADKTFNPFTGAADTSFNITAYDAETAEQILTFNTTLNGTVLSTTNGTITYNVTGFYNTVVNASGYQTVTTSKTYVAGTTTQWNLTAINRTVTFKAFDNTSTPINTFNMTTGTGATYTTTNGTIFASLDRTVLHNLTFKAKNFFDNVTLNYNVTSDLNVTLLSPFRDVTFTATNYSGSPISNFNLTVNGTTYSVVTSQVVNLDTREFYNVTFNKYNYFDDVQLNVNISSDVVGNLTEYFNILVGTESTSGGGTGTFVNGVNYSNVEISALTDFTNSTTALQDQSGSGHEFTLSGTATVDTGNGYLRCDGSTGSNATGSIAYNFTKPYTVSLKVNQDVATANAAVLSKYFNGSDRFYMFSSNTNWNARTLINTGNVATPTALNAAQDYVWTLTYDGSRVVQYIDGVVENNQTAAAPQGYVSNNKNIGLCEVDAITHNQWDGTITQLYIFDGALTQQEVTNHTQNVQNNNTFNPFTGGGAPVVVSDSTDQYYVNWNSTNYYPQAADNKTYLPVRFTLENFTVNPTTPEFKQAVFTNYNTTSHLAFTFNNSHKVRATNRYDSTAISNFTVNVSGTTYTANGTIAYLQNETGIVNYSVTHPSYFTAYGTNVNVTSGNSSVLMHQVEVRFNGSQRFTGDAVAQGNVTIGATKKAFGEPFYLNAGTYTATYSSVHDEAKPLNFTYTVLQNVTSTITNITNANLTITGRNAITGANIPFFTTTVVNDTLFINTSTTDDGPHLYNLIQNVTYNVEFDNSSYALNDTNITLTNRSTSLEFVVYTTNSFNISILDEQNQSRITNTNFTVEFIGSYASYETNYSDGNLYIDLITPDTYQIRYKYVNGTNATDYGMLRQYYYELTNRTYNPVDFYALKNSESTEITVTVQNADTLQREEGIIVLLQRYYIDQNGYETVAMYESDSQGRAYFDVELDNELYRFVMQSPLGTTLRTTEPAYLHETSYIIYTSTSVENIETAIDLGEIDATFDWDNATQQLTVTYTDPAALYSQYQLNLYEKGTYQNTLINTSTSTTSTGTLVVSYAFANDTQYIGTLSVSNSPAIEIARFSILDFMETQPLPNLSLFLVSILFTIMVFVSAFSLYSMVIGAVALVAAQMMGLLTFSTPVVGMILFGAIFLAVILEWRRG